jgi:hypothetical protein
MLPQQVINNLAVLLQEKGSIRPNEYSGKLILADLRRVGVDCRSYSAVLTQVSEGLLRHFSAEV